MLKDNFSVTLKLKWYNFFNKDKKILLEFEEASIEETLDYINKTSKANFETIEYLYNFFEKTSNWKINKKIFRKYITNNLTEILNILKKTYIKWVYTTENVEKIKETGEKMEVQDFYKDLGRLIAFLTEKMSIDPNNLLKNYTWRQLNFWIKHYLYLERAKTPKWQEENKKEDNKDYVRKNKKAIDASLAKAEKYLKRKV